MRSIFLIIVFVFLGLYAHALGMEDSLTQSRKPSPVKSMIGSKRKLEVPHSTGPLIQHVPTRSSDYIRPITNDVKNIREKIDAAMQKVTSEGRYVSALEASKITDYPVGLKQINLGIFEYTILIDSIYGNPGERFLDASMVFQTPNNKKLYFRAGGISFNQTGAFTGNGKLLLVGDDSINIHQNEIQLFIKGSENLTFVEFDCNGYKQLSLHAALVFSRNRLLPELPDGKIAPTGNVSINFTTTFVSWNDILVDIDIPLFQATGLPGFSFSVTDAVLDFSDERNPLAIAFPPDYNMAGIGPDPDLWRGVFIRNVTVKLPEHFKMTGVGSDTIPHRISLVGSNMVIDDTGFSGAVSANNIIPLEKGTMGNWRYSLNSIFVHFVSGEVTQGGFAGQLEIPMAKRANAQNDTTGLLNYTAVIHSAEDYVFAVSSPGKMNFDVLSAEVMINPGSMIEIAVIDGKFRPKATLHGQISFGAGLSGDGTKSSDASKNVTIPYIQFQDLQIQTVKPYVTLGMFALGAETSNDDKKLGGFRFSINQIGGFSNDDELGLIVGVTMAVSGSGDTDSFGATGTFRLVGEEKEGVNKALSYKFKRVEVESFGINIDKGSFKFKGTVNFYKQDLVYGNGLSGNIEAEFAPGIKVQASAIFGTKDNFRYWYVDALVQFNSGIPIFSGFGIYGFGGGAYYKMRVSDNSVGSPLGQTISGMRYVPDINTGLGLKATLVVGTHPNNQSFNGDVTFEIAFNQSGGVRYISFRGNGYFMTPPMESGMESLQTKASSLAAAIEQQGASADGLNEGGNANGVAVQIYGDPQNKAKAAVWASAFIMYDFENETLHGNLSAYVSVGSNFIKGVGPNGLAGDAVLHFAKGEWYIYIGRPEPANRFGLQVAGVARLDSYFVMGSVIPDTPPPPANVSAILGDIDLDYMGDLNGLADGSGVGFGASFSVDTGDITYLVFYGRFTAGLGFDIMLKDYGDVQCAGRGQLGINGWYANAQAYAYFQGEIGMRVKVWKFEKSVKILEIGAAVVAQAKLPNPVWVKGIAGGYFSVLGGAVKGNCRFEIEIGEECQIINNGSNSVLESIDVLAEATPQAGLTDVDVFTVPQAVFNYEMDREYEVADVNDQVVKFKISLDQFRIKQGSTILNSNITWNPEKTVAALNPFDILPPFTAVTVEIIVSFREYVNGQWMVSMSDGAPLTKVYSFSFTTGGAPDYIPMSNVAYSYPVTSQLNFYQSESNEIYLTLKQGQPDLFANTNEWIYNIRFESKDGQTLSTPVQYVAAEKELRSVKPSNLQNDKIYALRVMAVPQLALAKIDANVDTVSTAVTVGEGDELSLRSRVAEGSIAENQDKELLSYHFRVSRYNTLAEKIIAFQPSEGWRWPVAPGIHLLGSNIGGSEPFSGEELIGGIGFDPLIRLEADLTNVPWYNNEVYPIVYNGYPYHGLTIRPETRDVNVLGVVPTKGVIIGQQAPVHDLLLEDHINSGTFSSPPVKGVFHYALVVYMHHDYLDLTTQAANYMLGKSGTSYPRLATLLSNPFPVIKKGNYPVLVRYVLPGKNTSTSTHVQNINNPID